jgi:uncharacterized protein (TIGR02679 family)
MSDLPDGRLQRLLGGDHLAALRRRLRRHFERVPPGAACESFRISGLAPEEHSALASLTGRPPRFVGSLQIDIRAVDLALRQAGIAESLQAALVKLDGPVINSAAVRAEQDRLWSSVVAGCGHSGLAQYLQSPAAIGLLKRLSGSDPAAATGLRSRVEAVLRCLPAKGLTRAQLAADILGDPHALDGGQAVATLVLAVWRQVVGPAEPETEDTLVGSRGTDCIRQDLRAETARDTWARAGVLVNELARPAIVLNLPVGDGEHPSQLAGEPGYLSLRALLRSSPLWAVAGRTVYVCENPNLLAIAADRLGPRCSPVVCTDGMPAAAQNRLLSQLAQAGARLLYHGDFDWPGLRIGNYMMREFGAQPWQFTAADYVAAVLKSPRPGRQLDGVEALASWDAELASTMRGHQLAVAEESVADSLLLDLDSSGTRPGDQSSWSDR